MFHQNTCFISQPFATISAGDLAGVQHKVEQKVNQINKLWHDIQHYISFNVICWTSICDQ